LREARRLAPFTGPWRRLPGVVRHTFTHFHLELTVLAARAPGGPKGGGVWCAVERLSDHALPTVMKKVARHALLGITRHGRHRFVVKTPPPAPARNT